MFVGEREYWSCYSLLLDCNWGNFWKYDYIDCVWGALMSFLCPISISLLITLLFRSFWCFNVNFMSQLRPNFADAWSNLANAYMRKARVNEAAQCCRQALALNPNLVNVLKLLWVKWIILLVALCWHYVCFRLMLVVRLVILWKLKAWSKRWDYKLRMRIKIWLLCAKFWTVHIAFTCSIVLSLIPFVLLPVSVQHCLWHL